MKKVVFALVSTVCVFAFQATVCADVAAEAPASEKKACENCPTSVAAKAGECAECPVSKAMAALPKMTFKVGDTETCCDKAAADLVAENGGHIHYVVAKKEFDDKGEAMVALADVTEEFVDAFATPKTCSRSGKTTVCGTSLGCEKTAAKMAEKAKAAMQTVSLEFQVGEEKCSCPNAAAALAKKSGEAKQFVVGEETTCCEVDARIKLARAKYAAAVKALQASASTKTKVSDAT